MRAAAAWIALAVGILDAAATTSIARSEAFTRSQKLLQIAFVWLIPVLGALTMLYFTRYLTSEARDVPPDSRFPEPGPGSMAPQSYGGLPGSADMPSEPTVHGDS